MRTPTDWLWLIRIGLLLAIWLVALIAALLRWAGLH